MNDAVTYAGILAKRYEAFSQTRKHKPALSHPSIGFWKAVSPVLFFLAVPLSVSSCCRESVFVVSVFSILEKLQGRSYSLSCGCLHSFRAAVAFDNFGSGEIWPLIGYFRSLVRWCYLAFVRDQLQLIRSF